MSNKEREKISILTFQKCVEFEEFLRAIFFTKKNEKMEIETETGSTQKYVENKTEEEP